MPAMENISLFEEETLPTESIDMTANRPHLDVVKMEYAGCESVT